MTTTALPDRITSLVNLGEIDTACDLIVSFVVAHEGKITRPMADAWMALALQDDPTASESAATLRDCIRDNSDLFV